MNPAGFSVFKHDLIPAVIRHIQNLIFSGGFCKADYPGGKFGLFVHVWIVFISDPDSLDNDHIFTAVQGKGISGGRNEGVDIQVLQVFNPLFTDCQFFLMLCIFIGERL